MKAAVVKEPAKIFRLEQIQEAHAYLESAQSFGKVIVLNEEVKNDRN